MKRKRRKAANPSRRKRKHIIAKIKEWTSTILTAEKLFEAAEKLINTIEKWMQ